MKNLRNKSILLLLHRRMKSRKRKKFPIMMRKTREEK
jgi:hypothetical protein